MGMNKSDGMSNVSSQKGGIDMVANNQESGRVNKGQPNSTYTGPINNFVQGIQASHLGVYRHDSTNSMIQQTTNNFAN